MKETVRLPAGTVAGIGPVVLAADIYCPARLHADAKLLVCVPGGGITRRYYDLAGDLPELNFSFANAMTQAGHVVVTIDPPGVGESTKPEDGFAFTPVVQAELLHNAFHALRRHNAAGIDLAALPPIGVGHSAGTMLTVLHQAAYGDFSALVVLCFGTLGLPEHLTPEQVSASQVPESVPPRLAEFARAMFAGAAYANIPMRPDDSDAGRALRAVATEVVTVVAVQAMSPGNIVNEMKLIDVPLFSMAGARDMVGPPHRAAEDYPNCNDFTLWVMPSSGHHPFVARGAPELYRRILHWLDGLWLNTPKTELAAGESPPGSYEIAS